ncbi:cytoplasmic protein [Streptomyces sp. H10-C2]|uniref:cytoplasmic protein n=1 Tax=unclassified Streptomyces TaxID=2593676 RepID=UPI0024B983B3|nr:MULTISPECIES: cytoplasmic protein [unclassified Streptomyces]MDJ0346465.1 cytoplasmic protein [Streptomyces sp. PH10-H1]MDJ0374404.1 cytoplasmic protein [Streptomyces sp. H10-C2]
MSHDPAVTNPDLYKVVFENERVRILEYRDRPGDKTEPHDHPDSIMYTLTSFTRRLTSGDQQRELELEAGQVRWVGAQEHTGENIGHTDSHAIFVELKEPAPAGSPTPDSPLGPSPATGES